MRPSTRLVVLGKKLWTPAQISTDLWLDAADASTITLNGSTVSQWNDKSGNGRHVSQSTAARQPTLIGNRIQFDGSRFLICQPGWGNYWEWFLVLKFDRTDVLQVPIRDSSTPNSTTLHGYNINSSSFYRVRNTANSNYSSSISNEFGTAMRIHGYSSRTTNIAHTFVDGVEKTNWNVSGDMGTSLYLGTNGTFVSNGIEGSIYEFVLLSQEASNSTRQLIEGYLAWKWGLVANLLLNHPFKFNPPLA
ncbi:MAG: hypothetical protein ACKPIX_07645 [Dolichospermum sp.]